MVENIPAEIIKSAKLIFLTQVVCLVVFFIAILLDLKWQVVPVIAMVSGIVLPYFISTNITNLDSRYFRRIFIDLPTIIITIVISGIFFLIRMGYHKWFLLILIPISITFLAGFIVYKIPGQSNSKEIKRALKDPFIWKKIGFCIFSWFVSLFIWGISFSFAARYYFKFL